MTNDGEQEQQGIVCPTCHMANPPGSRFCERCGSRLTTAHRGVNGPTPAAAVSSSPPPDHRPGHPSGERHLPGSMTEQTETPGQTTVEPAALQAPKSGDEPTMAVDLTGLPAAIERSAPTIPFDLPILPAQPEPDQQQAEETTTSTNEPATPEQSTSTGWSYQSWTPPAPSAPPTAPPQPNDEEQSVRTRPAVSGPASIPAASSYTQEPTVPVAAAPVPGWQPPSVPASPAAPVPAPGYPGSYPPMAVPGTPPPAGAYPAAPPADNNRTLWIVLGIIGGLLILCIMGCVLIGLIGAFSAASTTHLATAVATTTRP